MVLPTYQREFKSEREKELFDLRWNRRDQKLSWFQRAWNGLFVRGDRLDDFSARVQSWAIVLGFVVACLLTALLIGAVSGKPAPIPLGASYGAIARVRLPKRYDEVQLHLASLNKTSAPADVHELRESLIVIRDHLDIFYAAYPDRPKADGGDEWRRIRKHFDSGYEILGQFQDLDHSHVKYSAKHEDERRNKCLHWKQVTERVAEKHDWAGYLSHPSTSEMWDEPGQRTLSKFWWGGVPESVRPSLDLTGLQNCAVLMYYSLADLLERHVELMQLDSIADESAHTTFHDYRKRLRSLWQLRAIAPDVFRHGAGGQHHEATVAVKALKGLYKQMGDLNDLWTKANLEHKWNMTSSGQDDGSVQQGWEKMKEAITSGTNVPSIVSQLQGALVDMTPRT